MCNGVGNIFRLAIVAGSVLALILQFFFMYDCDMLNLQDDGSTAGIWYLGFEGACVTDQYDTEDRIITAARSTAVLSMCAGAIASVLVAFEWLLCEVCCAGCVEGLAFFVAWASGGATFMVFGSEFCVSIDVANISNPEDTITCTYGPGATYWLVACGLYLIAGCLLCCAPQPDPLLKQCRK